MKDLDYELEWLKKWPAFEERPATVHEFLGPEYLNIAGKVRESIRESLVDIMGEEVTGERIAKYSRAMLTGGIGIGKTTVASIVLPWLCHWVLCLKDPQDYFDLLPGSRIAFMQMSTSGDQAKEVVFGDIFARIKHSPWFSGRYPYDSSYKTQIRFPQKDVWILPGDSAETTFEGYNILGGILDEADSHKVTKNKDYADVGYTSIYSRVTSRFQERGFILVIGQMKKSNGFAAKKYKEFQEDPGAYAKRMTIWESLGPDKYDKDEKGEVISFGYDVLRKQIVPADVARRGVTPNLLLVPETYKRDFMNNPEKALRDLAGIPPKAGDPFISLEYKIMEAADRWVANQGYDSPVTPDGRFESWFKAKDKLKRSVHIDLGYSGEGDACGIAMGHVRRIIDIDGEKKPYIVIDMLMRLHAPAGTQLFIGNIRRIVYDLRDKMGFNIRDITMDGFHSTDSMQQFQRRRFQTEYISVDKDLLPYEDLREAIYEDRIEWPRYLTTVRLTGGTSEEVEILYRELSELEQLENGKVDHPHEGSKDVADAVAGVTTKLMGDRSYRKTVVQMDSYRHRIENPAVAGIGHHALVDTAVSAPLPPDATLRTFG